jgi:hypothetical protein
MIANRIKSAEKQILIAEIEAHAKTKAEVERLRVAFAPTMVLLDVMQDSAVYSLAIRGELARLRAMVEKVLK